MGKKRREHLEKKEEKEEKRERRKRRADFSSLVWTSKALYRL